MELHPVLSIKFAEEIGIATLSNERSAEESTENLLQNPGFEEGATGWVASDRVISDDKTVRPHRGSWKAWFGGYGRSHSDSLYQEVSIPKDAKKAELGFYINIQSQESEKSYKVHDDLKLQIRDKDGRWIKTIVRYSNLDATRGYVREIVDLSAYRGKQIRIYFAASEDDGGRTSFLVDDFDLRVHR